MEENKEQGAQALTGEELANVAGGEGECGATFEWGPIKNDAETVGQAVIGVYDGLVEATSHVIETVVNAVK